MNATTRWYKKAQGSLGRLLCASLAVWAIGATTSPALASVTVDQVPLTSQPSLPPNIVLMLDDSGSMAWDFMPDAQFLPGAYAANLDYTNSWGASRTHSGYLVPLDVLRNSAENGLYYDPSVTYDPPVDASGASYGNSPGLTTAYLDGFTDRTAANEVDITRHSSDSLCDYNIPYSNWNCSAGLKTYFSYSAKKLVTTTDANGAQTTTAYHFFTYTTKESDGTYTQHYVGTTGSCSNASLASSVCSDSATSQQNVANWFSYYRTRMLMAKSGLMSAFSGVDPTYRVGFGSIDGNNNDGLPASGLVFTSGSNLIAKVDAFGDGSSSTSQKAKFWSWLKGEFPNNGTPLRASLDAVGKYYQDKQPWQTSSSDDAMLACRQAYTILTTDGFWNGSKPSGIGDLDSTDATAAITGPNAATFKYKAALPYSDTYSDTLADVAMKYWVNDLRSDVDNEVPTSTDDPAFWQHMVTFTMGLGFKPVDNHGTESDTSDDTEISVDPLFAWARGGAAVSGFTWPQPSRNGGAGSINNIADMAHAALDGHGGFYSATTPDSFTSGLKNALNRAASRVGTGASLAANSTSLDTGTYVYQANYYTAKWKGELKALAVDSVTGAVATSPTWAASEKLPAAGSRSIYTTKDGASLVTFKNTSATSTTDASGTVTTTPAAPPALSTAELAALGSDDASRVNMVDYLRGDSSLEVVNGVGSYRNRDNALGDIVDSQPVYVGKPNVNQFYNETFTGNNKVTTLAADGTSTSTGTSYVDDFANTDTLIKRTPMLYVAANDGMLHGFNATTGVEAFAYLPEAVITHGITDLASKDYGSTVSHKYFNDGELTVADVFKKSDSTWHTVLVGTTGRGTAKAVYALDITDPAKISLLWEHASGDGATNSDYIGQMTGKPVIAQTADAEWSVLMGNGYNSTKGVAALLQFDVFSGTLSVHATDTTSDNGLAAPAVWMDTPSNGISTMAYAGDLKGQVWSFLLNKTETTKSQGKTTTTYTSQPTSAGTLMYTAKDSGGKVQPITAGLLVGKDPATSNVWIFFGTGSYLASADLKDTSTQTWYGLIVQSNTSTSVVSTSSSRSNLVKRSIVAETAPTSTTLAARAVSSQTDTTDLSGKQGWYMDLLKPGSPDPIAEGERMVTPNQFQGNLLLATTRIPDNSDACNPSGRGWIMAVNPFTGANPTSNFFDLNSDGSLNSLDNVTVGDASHPAAGAGFNSLPNNPIFVGSVMLVSFDNGSTSSIQTSSSTGKPERVSWRELTNE